MATSKQATATKRRSRKKKLSRNGVPLGRPRAGNNTQSVVSMMRDGTMRQVNVYLDASMHQRLKQEAITRDALLSMLRAGGASGEKWPDEVVPTSGVSGVVAQAITDYFAKLDERSVSTRARKLSATT